MPRFTFALATVVFLAVPLGAQGLVPTYSDVAYGSHPREKLDVYVPQGPGPFPVFVEVHPGGWGGGFKSSFGYVGDLIPKIFAQGVAIVSIDYPVAPADPFPIPNYSCQRAVQFTREMAAAWGLDPERIAIGGNSSGGHLAAWVAMAPDAADPASADPVAQRSSRVRALYFHASPSDLTSEYYLYNSSIGHGTSPVWPYFGVTSQAEFDAVPLPKKQYASPRWLAQQPGLAAQDAQVSFLGIFPGVPSVTSTSALPKPNSDLHSLLQGLGLYEALRAAGAPDASFFIAPSVYPVGGVLPTADLAAEWLARRLRSDGVRNAGLGVAGCGATQLLGANGTPFLGNGAFAASAYDAYAGSSGLLLVSDLPGVPGGLDYFQIGLPILVDASSPYLIPVAAQADSSGRASIGLGIPNQGNLLGLTVYLQGVWLWPPPATLGGCAPSPFQLSTSNVLILTVQ